MRRKLTLTFCSIPLLFLSLATLSCGERTSFGPDTVAVNDTGIVLGGRDVLAPVTWLQVDWEVGPTTGHLQHEEWCSVDFVALSRPNDEDDIPNRHNLLIRADKLFVELGEATGEIPMSDPRVCELLLKPKSESCYRVSGHRQAWPEVGGSIYVIDAIRAIPCQ